MTDLDKEKDDFWDLDKIVPKKKIDPSPFATVSQVKEHNVSGGDNADSSERKLSFSNMPARSKTEDTVHEYSCGGLIRRVTIKRTVDKYDFYGNFRKAALIYYDYKTPKCEFTPYYSYMPQYSQLNSQQKSYYFYWRDEIRRGHFIKCDYSYVYLFVYEILNLPDKIEPKDGIRLICRIWREYRKDLPRIDAYFSVWLQDYCFVHNLPCPISEIRDFIFDVIAGADFKEFYLSDSLGGGADGIEAMIAYLSDYDWRRTKYAEGENAEIFRNHMLGSLGLVISRYFKGGKALSSGEYSILKRDAFPHSLCTHAVKCKLEIEYLPLAKDEQLRALVTGAVRYAENKLRALVGVKSRLGIKDLDDDVRYLIDGYFDNIFEMERRRRERECAPEYERLYDAEDKALSFSDADEIERASWTTTARLVVEDDEEGDESDAEMSEEAFAKEESTSVSSDTEVCTLGLSLEDIAALSALVYDGGDVSDDLFERINEAFLESFIGDIILEHDGEKYTVIEDYREDVEKWLTDLN